MFSLYSIRKDSSKINLRKRSIKNFTKNDEKPKKNNLFDIKILILIIICFLLAGLIICLSIILPMNNKIKEDRKNIQSSFKINTNVNSLSQFLMKSFQKHNSIYNDMNSSYSVVNKAIFDVFTLNETFSTKNNEYYSKIYNTTIIINSQCTEFGEKINDCKLEEYLDLTTKNKNNLRRNNENIEEIKEAILSICIIEHTDTNIILSITCPETLSENIKYNIISAFQSIKPNSCNKKIQNNGLIDTIINEKGNKINITMLYKNYNNTYLGKNKTSEIFKNITTDKNGNLKISKTTTKFEMIKDNNNKYYNSFNYLFEEIPNNNSKKVEINFKYNLNIIIELIKPLMKREEYISLEVLNNLNKNDSNSTNSIRKLQKENFDYLGVKEESFFSKSLYGINFDLKMKNDLGLGKGEKSKIISKFIIGTKINEFSHDEINTNINENLNKFIILSKAANNLANSLYKYMNQSSSNLINIINSNFSELNNLLIFEDLSSIFDSSLSINSLNNLPYSFINASYNLYEKIHRLYKSNLENSIINIKNMLKESITYFLNESHYLLDNIIFNLTELSDILSSNKSKITEISTYYLNDSDNSYVDIINKIAIIVDNYNLNEKNLIDSLLNKIFNEFSNKFLESMRIIQSLLDKVINKLNNKSLSILSNKNKDIKNVINYLSNTNSEINNIKLNI